MTAAEEPAPRERLAIAVVGHVDHGKSTLIARLLYEAGLVPEAKRAELEAASRRRGTSLEWSYLLDAFQAERDQAVTIDATHAALATARRDYLLIDAPGHKEFLKNMLVGAAQADAAILVVDATEGVAEQTRRHAYLLSLLGIADLVVAINKMDAVGYAAARFEALSAEIRRHLEALGLAPPAIVPVAAREGANLVSPSSEMPWHRGPTLLASLDLLAAPSARADLPLRFPVQDVYRIDGKRIIVGRIESGTLALGDRLLFAPGNHGARVKSIETWPERPESAAPVRAEAGQSIGLTLDEPIFVERGDVASHETRPPMLTHVFRARLLWLAEKPLAVGAVYRLRLGTRVAQVTVQAIERLIDTGSLAPRKADKIGRNEVGEAILRSPSLLALDARSADPALGRFVLVEGYEVVGAGIVDMEGFPDERQAFAVHGAGRFETDHLLARDARARRNGHQGAVIWFTGLSGAGKSTLAMEVERRLFLAGYQVYVLDGDNVRRGLNADLGFAPDDRVENIRRVGEVAMLFADAGFIVITAFISPYISDRARARAAAAQGAFHEVYIKADLELCERRDPKGLYKRARAGEIPDFTGVSAPYEPPPAPELTVDTGACSIEESVARVLAYIERHVALKPPDAGRG
ncbi:MAG TPA: adenylyl-sulfate kinase [Alphaproteobacteria bacterium]|nr:adenylyl-sulfate kinase [Alphaproteobacteria bacterium]